MINRILSKLGYQIVKSADYQRISQIVNDPVFEKLYAQCFHLTMTSKERMYALYKAVCYVAENRLDGCIVECGVWRGGSAMLAALTLKEFDDTSRKIYLYDTYEGMSEPTDLDLNFKGGSAAQMMKESDISTAPNVWCYADIHDVKNNLISTGYPVENLHFIKGKVEETIPVQSPEGFIALLRLDTDWYESTRHELEYLYPKLVYEGILIIDDYGHWAGCRKAVDEYFARKKILFQRIDYTGVAAVKTVS